MTSLNPLNRQDTVIGGKYRLGPVIGSGGVATVYRATHLWTEREVALKLLNPTLPHFERLREGFLREARSTVQLDHPNVVDVLDMGEDDWETAYLVMELLQGPTLRDVLLEHGRLSEEQTLAILLPLIDALEKAHQLGIVHRDFKPENIMLVRDPYGVVTPKLIDFGVAEILQDVRARSLSGIDDVIMGTPHYMSPEQARDDHSLIGPHTDVWGVAVVWYECLTGHAPFEGESIMEVLTAVCEAPVNFDEVPQAYVTLLLNALARPPHLRIPTLSELKARIERMGIARSLVPPVPRSLSSLPPPPDQSKVQLTLAGLAPKQLVLAVPETTQPDPEPPVVPIRSNRKTLLAGLALTIAVALSAWWTVGRPQEDRTPLTRPAIAGPEVLTEVVEPSPLPTEPVEQIAAEPIEQIAEEPVEQIAAEPAEEIAAEPAEEIAAEPAEEIVAQPVEEVAAEPEPKTAKPPPRKPRRKRTPVRRQAPPASNRPGYQEPPELVTEW